VPGSFRRRQRRPSGPSSMVTLCVLLLAATAASPRDVANPTATVESRLGGRIGGRMGIRCLNFVDADVSAVPLG